MITASFFGFGSYTVVGPSNFSLKESFINVKYDLCFLSTKSNIPEYLVSRYKRERFAETRKAKIRLSNIKIEEFTQVLKGLGKQIK